MIINADDFGYSDSVNEAICQCFKRGLINRTTIMVNMPKAEEAKKIAEENGFFDKVGLHINLTEGRALSEECRKSSLCDENGYLRGVFHIPLKSRFYLSSEIRKAIYAETKAQIEKYIDMGFTLMHADSHNFTHVYLSVYLPVSKLLKKYGFVSVRISRNIPPNDFSVLFKVYKAIFNFLIKRLKVKGKYATTTEYFGSVQDLVDTGDVSKYSTDTELMTHPDIIDGVLTDNTLPCPHPFKDEEWIKENNLSLSGTNNMKIKLLVCFIQAHIGGAMTSFVNFLNALDTDKYDVDVIFYENDGRYGIKEEINILPQGKIHGKYDVTNVLKKIISPRYVIAKLREIYVKKVQKNKLKAVQIMSKQGCRYSAKLHKKYDLAIAYEFSWALNYVAYRVNASKKLAWHHMDYENAGFDYKIDKGTFSRFDGLVFVSDQCRKSFAASHPEYKDRSYFVPNLLSDSYVKEKGDAAEVELPFDNAASKLRLLSVSRINFTEKGLDRAVRVFAKLKSDGLLENICWTIVGKGSKLEELKKMISDFDLDNYIKPIGLKENPIPYMKKADVLFLPSRNEGKPMVVTEGFIMGLVPVVTEYTSSHEQIEQGVDGIILENSEEGLYRGLREIFGNTDVIAELKENISARKYGNENEISIFDSVIQNI